MINKSLKYIFIASFLFFAGTLFTQLYYANTLAVKGKDMQELHKEKERISKEISSLELEISHYSSMAYIENRAVKLGFIKNDQNIATIRPATTTAVVPSL